MGTKTPDTRWEGGAVNLILDGAMPREVFAHGGLLICDFHKVIQLPALLVHRG